LPAADGSLLVAYNTINARRPITINRFRDQVLGSRPLAKPGQNRPGFAPICRRTKPADGSG